MVELKEIKEIIEEVMGLNLDKFDFNVEIDTISEWDSFNNLMLISRFQEELGIEFTTAEIEHTTTIQQIIDIVLSKC